MTIFIAMQRCILRNPTREKAHSILSSHLLNPSLNLDTLMKTIIVQKIHLGNSLNIICTNSKTRTLNSFLQLMRLYLTRLSLRITLIKIPVSIKERTTLRLSVKLVHANHLTSYRSFPTTVSMKCRCWADFQWHQRKDQWLSTNSRMKSPKMSSVPTRMLFSHWEISSTKTELHGPFMWSVKRSLKTELITKRKLPCRKTCCKTTKKKL